MGILINKMKTNIIIKVAIWLVIAVSLFNSGLQMVSAPSTVENLIGFFIVVIIVIITIKTKFLTTLNFKRKHEK